MGAVKSVVGSITGSTSRDAAKESGAAERDATRQAIEAQEQAYREVAPGMAQFLAPQYQRAFQQSYIPEEFQELPPELGESFDEANPRSSLTHDRGLAGWKTYKAEGRPGDFGQWQNNKIAQLRTEYEQQNVQDLEDYEKRKADYMETYNVGGFGGGGGFGGAGTGEYGTDPLSQMRAASGTLGSEAQSNFFQNFQEDPGTQFLRNQGMRSIDRQSSAMGGLGGGSRLKALSEFNQGLANQQLGQRLGQLGGLAQTDIGIGSNLANLRTGLGSAQAQSMQNMGTSLSNQYSNVAAAKNQGGQNMMGLGMMAAGFSDRRLKENIHKVGEWKGLTIYKWSWKPEFEWLTNRQVPIGFIADEISEKYPDAVTTGAHGFSEVNYSMILDG